MTNSRATGNMGKTARYLVASMILMLSAGCGGQAGDGASPDVQPLEFLQFIGVWDITGNWNGRADDQALLVIRDIDSDGTNAALIYDLDESIGNCHIAPILTGNISLAIDNTGRVFLNLFEFPDAVISIASGELVIDYVDRNDVNQNGDSTDAVAYRATSVSMVEDDIPLCGPAA